MNLKRPDLRLRVKDDPLGFMQTYPNGAILDEVQQVPELLSYIQVQVDEIRQMGMYVLTGSHQPVLRSALGQSLAGRTAILELLPLSLDELTQAQCQPALLDLLVQRVYPKLYDTAIPTALSPAQMYADYVATYVERDVRQLVQVRNLNTFLRFLGLCAGRILELLNIKRLATETGVSEQAVRDWLSVLEAGYIMFQLRPWSGNIGKRLVRSPKWYFCDVGLAAHLLQITRSDHVTNHPLRGSLFETMIIADALKTCRNLGHHPGLFFTVIAMAMKSIS